MPRRIENTTERMAKPTGSLAFIADAMLVGTSNTIEMMEASGQAQLAKSSQLPTDGLAKTIDVIPAIQAIGPSSGDPIFTDVKLPEGWSIRPTDHAMHSDLVDEKGRKRAGIFYKAAFYDRSASIHPVRRFSVERDYASREEIVFRVTDGGQEIWRSRSITPPTDIERGERWKWQERVEVELRAEALAFLQPQYPDWENASAYWD